MTKPTWEEIYAMKPLPTAQEAAAIRGVSVEAAWTWSGSKKVKWARGDKRANPIPWGEYHHKGFTAHEAAKDSGGDIRLAMEWAKKKGVSWPVRFRDDSETVKRDPKKPRNYAFSCSPRAIKRWEERAGL